MAMPPMLRWGLSRVPLGKAEKERLEREELEAKGFVPNLERLLLAVDESPNGKFATRLAGVLAGTRGVPITLLPLATNGKSKAGGQEKKDEGKKERDEQEKQAAQGDRAEDEVTTAAQENQPEKGEDETPSVEVTIRRLKGSGEQAVAAEARKGYDLLLTGVGNTVGRNGAFHGDVARIALAFDGPLAIVAGKGIHLEHPQQSPLHILVPVNGTDVSRRAAEVAISIAHACDCPITALYVANPGGSGARTRRRSGFRARYHEQAIVKEIVEMADRYDVEIKTTMHADVAPDAAIIAEAKRREHDLIIMGVGRRPGDKLFFGDTAAAVLDRADASIVFVAS
jgi:nucleotide-binding universal stress UspA family protein